MDVTRVNFSRINNLLEGLRTQFRHAPKTDVADAHEFIESLLDALEELVEGLEPE